MIGVYITRTQTNENLPFHMNFTIFGQKEPLANALEPFILVSFRKPRCSMLLMWFQSVTSATVKSFGAHRAFKVHFKFKMSFSFWDVPQQTVQNSALQFKEILFYSVYDKLHSLVLMFFFLIDGIVTSWSTLTSPFFFSFSVSIVHLIRRKFNS